LFGYRKPSVVISSTFGVPGASDNTFCSTRAVVLLPAATLPAMPMMNGKCLVCLSKNELVWPCSCRKLSIWSRRRWLRGQRSEEHTSELQTLMHTPYTDFL